MNILQRVAFQLTRERLSNRWIVIKDYFSGLDFNSIIEPERVGLNPQLAFASVPSGFPHLKIVLNDLGIKSSDSIIDIGCGKGSAMRTFLSYPFNRVDGIELSAEISNIAINNFNILKAKNVNVYCGDASKFEALDDYNYIYFYNPFPASVMKLVMKNVVASLERKNRPLKIIYDNPTCNQEIMETGLFQITGEYLDVVKNYIYVYFYKS
jgi:SAM-dependent methyltransferase